jgi:hypothetical protein
MTISYLQPNQPDVLEVIANLSNDAVFTPPRVVNDVLDLLPEEVWTNPELRWLDPCSKTGVFPREVTKRLMEGLSQVIPDETERLTHILSNMVSAIATEEITAMMTRRSLYCSKNASSEHSAVQLSTPAGRVWHERVEHKFNDKGRCVECNGTSEKLEVEGQDNKAYGPIHAAGRERLAKEFMMKFDVVIGNPPYQMADGGPGGSASPIYNLFVEEAIKLNPRFVAMIIPSKWFVGGKGLREFRTAMRSDRRLRAIVDYQDARSLFPTINLNGGINYFLWDREHDGPCEITSVGTSGESTTLTRFLDTWDVVVRQNEAVSILEKVLSRDEDTFEDLVSNLRPFGLRTYFRGKSRKPSSDPVELFQNGGKAWVKRSELEANVEWVDRWKVLIPRGTDGNEIYPLPVLTEPIVAGPGTACTETYLVVGPVKSKTEAERVAAYMKTRFFRFLLSLRKPTQDNSREKFSFIPRLAFDRIWTDEELYAKYGITKAEQAYIASMIKGMPS